jgi:hypothetical protein
MSDDQDARAVIEEYVAACSVRMGLDFIDYFHLVKVDGRWKIVSKTFTTL